jgi:hypothetical protein
MPDPAARGKQIVAFAMMVSAITLGVIGYLIFAGTIPVPEDARPIVGGAVGVAAVLDLVIGIWFFSKGQSA